MLHRPSEAIGVGRTSSAARRCGDNSNIVIRHAAVVCQLEWIVIAGAVTRRSGTDELDQYGRVIAR